MLPPVLMTPHFGSVSTSRDAHVAPVDFELIGEDAGDGRADVLAHFRADDVHGHDAIAVEAVPNRGFEGARPRLLRGAFSRRETERDGRAGHADQKGAARKRALMLRAYSSAGNLP